MISQNISSFVKKIATASAAFLVTAGLISSPAAQAQTITVPDIGKVSSMSSMSSSPNIDVPNIDVPNINIPNIDVPNFDVPKIPTPQLPSFTPPAPFAPPAPKPAPQVSNAQRAQNIIKYTNVKRAQHGLAPVVSNPELQVIAQQWAEQNMREDNLYHRPQYWTAYPKHIRPGGENILQAWSDYSDEQLVQLWYDSPGHRKNMLDPKAKSVGIGVAIASNGKLYAVQDFGR